MISIKCAIDPGRHKIGVAFSEEGRLLFSAIIPKSSEEVLLQSLKERKWKVLDVWKKEGDLKFLEDRTLEKILLGNGTSSEELYNILNVICELETADEYGTTLKGRELYWKLHPPKGLWKLVPTSLRTPPRDIDDLAAWAIIK
ncbi:MAG: endonuclease [Synergistaceae bacterium]|nr:endonuclease [Synergistaceae bacterium]